MTIATIKANIEAKKLEIKEKQAEMDNFEITVSEREYDDFLNDCYEEVEICGQTYAPAYALKMVDEISYNTGKSDYEGSQEKEENEDYKELMEDLETLESELEDLESELEEAEENEE